MKMRLNVDGWSREILQIFCVINWFHCGKRLILQERTDAWNYYGSEFQALNRKMNQKIRVDENLKVDGRRTRENKIRKSISIRSSIGVVSIIGEMRENRLRWNQKYFKEGIDRESKIVKEMYAER